MLKEKWNNHGIPAHYENLIVRVTKRQKRLYFATTLNDMGNTYEPYSENGIVILTSEKWSTAYKVCFDYIPTMEERGAITRYIKSNLLPDDSKYHSHTEPKAEE
jgi:hypothetical protein